LASRPKRVAVLFPSCWDRRFLVAERFGDIAEFVFHGDPLWSFPGGFFKILALDPLAFVDRLVRDLRRAHIDAVLSTDEYLGVGIAAVVADRLGLPGPEPETALRLQHKYYARKAQQQIAPEAVPDFQLIRWRPTRDEIRLSFPLFVKPVRGSFSILAARVDSWPDLRRHLGLNPILRFAMRRLVAPFDALLREHVGGGVDATSFLGEAVLRGRQVTVEGYAFDGRVTVRGIVDAHMYPGTNAFERFEYPSSLPPPVRARMTDLAERLVCGLGIRHGTFNVELIWDPERDELGVIEVHPRLSYQFADLYEDVDGTSPYDTLVRLALGEEPRRARGDGRYPRAASLVLREFSGRRVRRLPRREAVEEFHRRHPGARVEIFAREGTMFPEMRALGSYRCAIVNLGAHCPRDVAAARTDVDRLLRCEVS
jgi:hypothetical protein